MVFVLEVNKVMQIPFPKSVHLHKIGNGYYLEDGRPWKYCKDKCAHFTTEIRAIVKIYDRNYACFHT